MDILAVPNAAANDAAGSADVADLKHGACMALMEVLCLCNAHRAENIPELEGLALEVTDDIADVLWTWEDALLDSKAECCQGIDSLREDLESGAIAGACLDHARVLHVVAASVSHDFAQPLFSAQQRCCIVVRLWRCRLRSIMRMASGGCPWCGFVSVSARSTVNQRDGGDGHR